jgi:SAM-dependent methyltransferase
MTTLLTNSDHDRCVLDHERALAEGLWISGESKEYFAEARMRWLATRLARMDANPEFALDFGCGTGTATPFFFEILGATSLIGMDVSDPFLHAAAAVHGGPRTRFIKSSEYTAKDEIDLAFCNGVFHHIPPAERPAALGRIFAALRPGGLLALWENNPWNPGTRYVMSRISFDRDANLLWPGQARRLLRQAGFEILRTDFAFIFPAMLKWLRPLEPHLCRVALGAQYMVLARKPLTVRQPA